MGRSVSYPRNAVVCFQDWSHVEDEVDFDMEVECVKNAAASMFPSMCECSEWVGREDHAVLENGHAYIGYSAYCGLASIWLLPKDGSLAQAWVDQVSHKFMTAFGEFVKVGTFSNGEALYKRVEDVALDRLGG